MLNLIEAQITDWIIDCLTLIIDDANVVIDGNVQSAIPSWNLNNA